MPLYDYRCTGCGDFRQARPMAESGAPGVCPVCGAPSERVITAPFLAGSNATPSGARPTDRIARPCGHGHGCSHAHGA
jgi:putative FmdB family regulatory protein